MNAPRTFPFRAEFNALTAACWRRVVRSGDERGKSLRRTVRTQGGRSFGRRARPRRAPTGTVGEGADTLKTVARKYFPQ